jgi:hypothetical protein
MRGYCDHSYPYPYIYIINKIKFFCKVFNINKKFLHYLKYYSGLALLYGSREQPTKITKIKISTFRFHTSSELLKLNQNLG